MTADLSGLRVWLTRPLPAAEASEAQWRARGASVLAAATVVVEPCAPSDEQRRRLEARAADLDRAIVALVSPRAVDNFVGAFGATAPAGRPWRTAAVGAATAEQARARGLAPELVAERAVGTSLAAAILALGDVDLVVVPSSDRRRAELGDALREGGVEVLELTVHRTVPATVLDAEVRAALESGRIDVIAAYSPSALAFVGALDPPARALVRATPVAALGPTTASAARDAGLDVAVEPEAPGEDALLDAVARWWRGRAAEGEAGPATS